MGQRHIVWEKVNAAVVKLPLEFNDSLARLMLTFLMGYIFMSTTLQRCV